MMEDPYAVLGLDSTASKDEVKRAYRKLALRYHPDSNPGDRSAEEKMKRINAAYDAIMNPSRNPRGAYGGAGGGTSAGYGRRSGYPGGGAQGGYGYGYGYGWTWPSGAKSSEDDDTPLLRSVRSYILSGDYEEALHVLSTVDIHDRTVRWYYYSALAYRYQGKLKLAEEAALRAVEMDPANLMYRRLLIEIRTPEVKRAPAEEDEWSTPSSVMRNLLRWLFISLLLTILVNLPACVLALF